MTRTAALADPRVLPDTQFANLPATVEQIRDHALAQARRKMPPKLKNAGYLELLQRPDFIEYFKFSLADGVAQSIVAMDDHVQAVYYFDPHLNPDAETETLVPTEATINLLLVVKSNSAALKSFISLLDSYLTEALRALPSTLFASLPSVIHVMFVTQEDIAQRRGYALVLNAIYTPPKRIL